MAGGAAVTRPVNRITRPTTFAARTALAAVALLVVLVVVALALKPLAARAIALEVHHAAARRGLTASWDALRFDLPPRVTLTRLRLVSARGDTVCGAESLRVTPDLLALLLLHPGVRSVEVAHARLTDRGGAAADPDTLAPDVPARSARAADRSAALRRAADGAVRALLLPARSSPRIVLRDVTLTSERGDEHGTELAITWLDLEPGRSGLRLAGAGALTTERTVPFTFELRYGDDDRIAGGARFEVPDPASGTVEPLRIGIRGALSQQRRSGLVHLADSTRITVGELPFVVGATLDRHGPRVTFHLGADQLTADLWKRSVPHAVLGPLMDLAIRGSYDYRVSLDLDLARPDSVAFDADVIPHGLVLEGGGSRLDLGALGGPFVASIHLPHDRIVTRDLSGANPHFRPLGSIDSLLTYAVVTNEDGAFFRHHGFNTEAVRGAIADNIRAGGYRRGAGTITMQLVRNLYLGHARTLSRKGQEVVLAWVIEHLTSLSKERMLEIYLNIIEWGAGVHGADEAAYYYFGHDAGRLSVDEALFLTTVIPAPTKWRYRFDPSGDLRPFERAQMHFIGRAMIAKGWLAPDRLPPAEALRVEIRGPARDVLFPRDAPPGTARDSVAAALAY